MDNNDDILKLLDSVLTDIEKVNTIQLSSKITIVISALSRFGETHLRITRMKEMLDSNSFFQNVRKIGYNPYPNYQYLKEAFTVEVKSLIQEIKTIGLPQLKPDKDTPTINVKNTNYQSQHQEQHNIVSLDVVLEIIRSEIGKEACEDLQAIYKTEGNLEKRRDELFKKLKTFGLSALSGILSNVLTQFM